MPPAEAAKTARLIRELRQQLNLSQEKFAAQLGVSFRTVNRWENERSLPSPMAWRLIENLRCQVAASSNSNGLMPSMAIENKLEPERMPAVNNQPFSKYGLEKE